MSARDELIRYIEENGPEYDRTFSWKGTGKTPEYIRLLNQLEDEISEASYEAGYTDGRRDGEIEGDNYDEGFDAGYEQCKEDMRKNEDGQIRMPKV